MFYSVRISFFTSERIFFYGQARWDKTKDIYIITNIVKKQSYQKQEVKESAIAGET